MGRFRFVARRLLHVVPVSLIVLIATFSLLKLVKGDPARAVAGPRASDEAVAAIRAELGLDDSVVVQFGRFVQRVMAGDLGTSTTRNIPVTTIIEQNAPVTLWLVVAGTLASVAIAVPLALLAARRPGGGLDHAVRSVSLFGLTIPPFWVGVMLLSFVAVPTGWFTIGDWPDGFLSRLRAIVLPALTLGLAIAPVLIRSLRVSLLDVMQGDHVVAARAVGIDGWHLTRRFVLRNALVPTVALLATVVGYLLFGTVLVEATFGLPGLGQTMVQSAVNRDFPVVQGLTLVFATAVVVVNLLGDLGLAALDPRISVEG